MSGSSFETDERSASAERTPHPPCLRQGTFSHKGRRKKARGEGRDLLPRFFAEGLAVALQAVEVHADVGGFGRGVCERNRAVEGGAGLVVAAKLHQEGAAHAEEMKIV